MKWFKHDSDANRDVKLEKVLMRYGAEGYALYWLCLELIAAPIDTHNINFELEHDSEILAHRLRMDSAKVEEIMKYMVGLGLFEINHTTSKVTCLKLAHRLENSIVKNHQLKEIQQLIENNNPGQSGKIPDNPGKPRPDIDIDLDTDTDKKKTNTTDHSRANSPRNSKGYSAEFESAWGKYPKRNGNNPKRRANQAWNARLKTGVHAETLRAGVERYAAWCQGTGKIGTESVMQAATFFGPDEPFLNTWELPREAHKQSHGSAAEDFHESLKRYAKAEQ